MSDGALAASRAAFHRLRWPSSWTTLAIVIALPIVAPIVAILATFFAPASDVWAHLRDTVLLEYIVNTVALLLLVGVVAAIVGAGCAYLTATREFPGRGVFAWALILPLAAPAYVVAYAYADLLGYGGFVYSIFIAIGLDAGTIPALRSLPGAGLILGFTLYPYVYLLTYNAFAEQAGSITEAARTLGASKTRVFFRVALPHARPAIAGGLALALMETAADFGVVQFFGVPTLTYGVFRAWYAMGESQAALQLAGWLFLVVMVLVVFERLARRGSHANPSARNVPPNRLRLTGIRAWLACGCCAIPVLLGLAIPGVTLLAHAFVTGDPTFGWSFFEYIGNTVFVAGVAALMTAFCALLLTYAMRLQSERKLLRFGVQAATLGYALPGLVLAVGVIGPLTSLDKLLARSLEAVFDFNVGLLITGSIGALVFVYLARFLAVAFNSLDSGMARIHPNYDDAARSLGARPRRLLATVHLPLLTPAFLTALLLVFVDVVKELPATLILRPFNFETLATRAYRLASDERLAEAATACILIVLIGLVATGMLAVQNFGARNRTRLSV